MTEPAKSSPNVVLQKTAVTREDRARVTGQRGVVLWFTGLSGSGKSTVASAVEQRLNAAGRLTYLLDGDNVRHGLNGDLGFSDADRTENIRRVAHVSRLFWDANVITLVSFISPFRAERTLARALVGADFVEVFVDAPLELCEQRDVKGLYKKARAGEIRAFTGISSPYEAPESPEIHLKTGEENLDESVQRVLEWLTARDYVHLH
ncbi:MAG TPA: adenylyl-sulfate kinase [Fibrobacteria bacterium]|jgi:adenylyl-sulfate kinase|nr:adenylyl-sulfate kinase [Fibrobacteria bacterium]